MEWCLGHRWYDRRFLLTTDIPPQHSVKSHLPKGPLIPPVASTQGRERTYLAIVTFVSPWCERPIKLTIAVNGN